MTTVILYKTIFRFHLFNLPIDHRKLISPLSIEFIRMLKFRFINKIQYNIEIKILVIEKAQRKHDKKQEY